MTNPRALKCKHVFCSKCLKTALDTSNKCPVCQEPQGVLQGNQPPGEMTERFERYSVPGYEGNFESCRCFVGGSRLTSVESRCHSNLTQVNPFP